MQAFVNRQAAQPDRLSSSGLRSPNNQRCKHPGLNSQLSLHFGRLPTHGLAMHPALAAISAGFLHPGRLSLPTDFLNHMGWNSQLGLHPGRHPASGISMHVALAAINAGFLHTGRLSIPTEFLIRMGLAALQ